LVRAAPPSNHYQLSLFHDEELHAIHRHTRRSRPRTFGRLRRPRSDVTSYIDMGGMFTILKVRKDITSYADPGWYKHPPGTVAEPAVEQELRRDGIDVTRTYAGTAAAPLPAPPASGHGAGHNHETAPSK
jgi:hypothetical protein